MSLDYLLVNPNNRIVSPFAAVEPPLWLGLMASHYRQQGKKVAVLDAEAYDLCPESVAWVIKMIGAKRTIFVAMGNNPSVSSTPKMPVIKRTLKAGVNNTDYYIAGLHPSALPEETEAELGIEVLRGTVLDNLPWSAWDLLPIKLYRAHNWHCLDGSPRSPYASIYTSLGCPFNCDFCNIHALYGGKRKVWFRDPDDVIREIGHVRYKYGVRNIKFWDELFTLDHKRVAQICRGIRQMGLNIWAYARVDTVTPMLLATMKQGGINWVGYGIESGSDEVLKGCHKRQHKNMAREAVEMAHEAGIHVNGNFMFGMGYDEETLAFAKSLNLEYANFYDVKDYPGSKIYAGNRDWNSYDQYGKRVETFRDRAFSDFFGDEQYHDNLHRKFGEQAVRQVKAMLAYGKPVTRGAECAGK